MRSTSRAIKTRDWKIVDYHMYQHVDSGLFRGPEPIMQDRQYVTCLGAAQTLGCFCEAPFPQTAREQARR